MVRLKLNIKNLDSRKRMQCCQEFMDYSKLIRLIIYPLCPVAFIDGPTYFLSQQYDTMPKNSLPKLKSHNKNSFELKGQLEKIIIPEGHVLISLDVTSLYTIAWQQIVIESIKKAMLTLQNS